MSCSLFSLDYYCRAWLIIKAQPGPAAVQGYAQHLWYQYKCILRLRPQVQMQLSRIQTLLSRVDSTPSVFPGWPGSRGRVCLTGVSVSHVCLSRMCVCLSCDMACRPNTPQVSDSLPHALATASLPFPPPSLHPYPSSNTPRPSGIPHPPTKTKNQTQPRLSNPQNQSAPSTICALASTARSIRDRTC